MCYDFVYATSPPKQSNEELPAWHEQGHERQLREGPREVPASSGFHGRQLGVISPHFVFVRNLSHVLSCMNGLQLIKPTAADQG